MKVMVIGGGGREHAVVRSLKKSPQIDTLYALPGNGGIAADAVCVPIEPTDAAQIAAFAKENEIGYAVVTPGNALEAGVVDALEDAGIPCFGPRKNAALLESSKSFAKGFMKKYGIPTADYRVFSDPEEALSYVETVHLPVVVKADGLARGKGVLIAKSREEAKNAVSGMLRDGKFGTAGQTVVIEELLHGPEVSVQVFTDGTALVPMVSCMDHKRARNGDTGLNTGGMGAVAPNPYYTPDIAALCMDTIFRPTLDGLRQEGIEYRGCLYFGLMLTRHGPMLLEYNCRLGDPEAQTVLPLLESDLFTILRACTEGKLDETEVRFSSDYACCVVTASEGYPEKFRTGFEIYMPDDAAAATVIAGARLQDGVLLTSGGRVAGTTAAAPTLSEAVRAAYRLADRIHFENAYRRRDIGAKALQAF